MHGGNALAEGLQGLQAAARLAASAFSGEGARLYGGRWSPKGHALFYTAESQSLALLEMLVQDAPLRARYVLIPAQLPADLAVPSAVVPAERNYLINPRHPQARHVRASKQRRWLYDPRAAR